MVFLLDCLSSGNPVHVDHASAVKKKFVGGFALSGFLGSGRGSMLPLGTRSLWVIAVDPAFIAGHQSINNCGIWIDLVSWHLSFWSFLSTLATNFAQIFRILCSSWIIVCTVPTLTSIDTMVLIHEILYLANQLWCFDFLTPLTPLIIPHRLPAFLESLMPLKTDSWFIQDDQKAVWSIPYVSVAFLSSLKLNFITYRSF